MNEIERFGDRDVMQGKIVEFARNYDPQPFHVDPDAARHTRFGGLVASGWHTAAMAMRMLVDHMSANGLAGEGAFGIDDLRWLKPVRPGDWLHCTRTIESSRVSRSRLGLAIQKSRIEVLNQHGEVVLRFAPIEMVKQRTGIAPLSDCAGLQPIADEPRTA